MDVPSFSGVWVYGAITSLILHIQSSCAKTCTETKLTSERACFHDGMNATAHSDFAFPVNYTAAPLPEDGYAQVAATIEMMRQYVRRDTADPVFMDALAAFRRATGLTDPCQIAFSFARSLMYFQRDETTGYEIDPQAIEVLVRPVDAVLLYQRSGHRTPGDCDCFSMLVAAALTAMDVPCAFVTVAADLENPSAWSHVYVVAQPGTDQRCAIDASHGSYAGWEVPGVTGYREWPLMGGGIQTAVVLGFLLAAAGVICYMGAR